MYNPKAAWVAALLCATHAFAAALGAPDSAAAAGAAALVNEARRAAPQLPVTGEERADATPELRPDAAANEIAAINRRIAVMQAQLAELEVRAKIAAVRASVERTGQQRVPPSKLETSISAMQDTVVPSVREISGVDHRIWAVLNVRGGTQIVRVGDTAAGWRVSAITPEAVTVGKGGRELQLSFGAGAIRVGGEEDAGRGEEVGQGIPPPMPLRVPASGVRAVR